MSTLTDTHAGRIRDLHEQAQALAETAIERALEAGRLLAEVKAALPHGDFGAWIEQHCGFAARTAQRYIRLHENRARLPADASISTALAAIKCDTLSHLDGTKDYATVGPAPDWLPDAEAVTCSDGMGRQWFAWRTPELPGHFARALVRIGYPDGSAAYEGTRRSTRHDLLSDSLRLCGLSNPDAADWLPVPAEVAQSLHDLLLERAS